MAKPMNKNDWYRNTEWNEQVEMAFTAKLKRARNKSQYLRIQASMISQSYPKQALKLLDEYFTLGEDFDFAQAYVDRASAYLSLNQVNNALQSYEDALKREAEFPKLLTNAYLHYPFVIAKREIRHLFQDALTVLDKHSNRPIFPIDRYKWNASKALIYSVLGETETARNFAIHALKAGNEDESGFKYHQKSGLFQKKTADQKAYKKLTALTKGI